VGDSYAVVDNFTIHEHPFIFRFLLTHGLRDWPLAYYPQPQNARLSDGEGWAKAFLLGASPTIG